MFGSLAVHLNEHEALFPGSLCLLQLVDEAGRTSCTAQHNTAPKLPADLLEAVDAVVIGPTSAPGPRRRTAASVSWWPTSQPPWARRVKRWWRCVPV